MIPCFVFIQDSLGGAQATVCFGNGDVGALEWLWQATQMSDEVA